MQKNGFFDCHCHTHNSPDSKSTPEELCRVAIEKGLSGVAFTDHCNVNYFPEVDVLSIVKNSCDDAIRMRELYSGKLKVLRGVELGNIPYNPEIAKEVLSMQNYDIVVGSVHSVKYGTWENTIIAKTDFKCFDDNEVNSYLRTYFQELLRMVTEEDIDAVAHFSFPVRYITTATERRICIDAYLDLISEILKKMIERSIALEFNSNNLVPRKKILGKLYTKAAGAEEEFNVEELDVKVAEIYYAMGGRIVTLGSDSHAPERVAREFDYTADILRRIGFSECYYFENRTPVPYSL